MEFRDLAGWLVVFAVGVLVCGALARETLQHFGLPASLPELRRAAESERASAPAEPSPVTASLHYCPRCDDLTRWEHLVLGPGPAERFHVCSRCGFEPSRATLEDQARLFGHWREAVEGPRREVLSA